MSHRSHGGTGATAPPGSAPWSIARTRLLPPQLPPGCLPRRDLVARVAAASGRGAVAVIAGAGYGKSTLLAQVAAQATVPVAWCSLDEEVRDEGALVAHVFAAVAERLPGFGAGAVDLAGLADPVTTLANEVLDTVAGELLLVLDDVHALPPPAAVALDRMVGRLPHSVRLLLASRNPLPISRRRLLGRRTSVIDERALAVAPGEAAALFLAMERPLAADDANRLTARCEGWVTGIILAAHAGGSPASMDGAEELAGYLGSEVLGALPSEGREFLMRTAAVERFCPSLAEALTDRPDAGEVILGLVERHLFCIPTDGDTGAPWYRYHHLLRDFLRSHLRLRRPAVLTESNRRAAGWYRARGEPFAAVPHLIAAGDHAGACELLEPVSEAAIRGAHASDVRGWLTEIPRPLWARRPPLVLAHAALLSLDGRYEDAFRETVAAVERLLRAGDHDRAALVLCRLIRARGGVGLGLVHGVDHVASLIGRVDPGARSLPLAHILLGGFYGWLCRFEEAERHVAAGLGLPQARGDAVAHLYAAVNRAHLIERIRGRAGDVPEALDAAIQGLQERREEDPFDFVVHASGFRAFALSYVGRHHEAIEETRRQRALAARTGESVAAEQVRLWIEVTALAESGRADELARRLAADARGGGPFAGSAMGYYLNACRAGLHALRGDRPRMVAEIETCRALMSAHLGHPDFTALTDLACAALGGGERALAQSLAGEALGVARASGAGWGRARAAMLVAAAAGRAAPGEPALAEAMQLTERLGLDDLWVRKQRALAPALLDHAMRHGIGEERTRARLAAACGLTAAEGCAPRPGPAGRPRARVHEGHATAPADAPPLRIHVFGPLRVVRDGCELPRAAFGRERARLLLAVLSVHPGPVARDRLLDWLWPALSPDRGTRALSTTLHALRGALQPCRADASGRSPVALGPDTCELLLGDGDAVDLRDFMKLSRPPAAGERPAARLERLRAAESLCDAELLPEWPYADWAEDVRRQVAERREGVLADLAECLMDLRRPDEAVDRLRRLVTVAPEREEWHRRLMAALDEAGESALALRQFHACRTVLRRELGVEASAATRALYRRILARC